MSKLFILSAPSGAGKSSLAKALVESVPETVVSVSHTTRLPRPGEQNGVHYYFVSTQEFDRMVKAGDFLEHARVFDHCYGTSRTAIETLFAHGQNVVLDIDWQGARSIKQALPRAVSIFILPPSLEGLRQRLQDRKQDAPEVIKRRMRAAIDEMRHYEEFDYVIVNDIFTEALADLQAIVRGDSVAVRPLKLNISELLQP